MSNGPVKTTPLDINNQGLNDELRCIDEQLAIISSITSDSRESGSAGNGWKWVKVMLYDEDR